MQTRRPSGLYLLLTLAFACGPREPARITQVSPAVPAAPTAPTAPTPASIIVPESVGSASPAPAPAPATKSAGIEGDVETVFQVPAWDARIVAGTAVILEEDFLTVAGYDTQTGKRIFREKVLEKPGGGRHTLTERRGKVLYWAGDKMIMLDPKTGAHDAAVSAPMNGSGHFDDEGLVCAFSSECSLSIVDCETLRPFNKAIFDKTYVEMFPDDGPPSGGCYGRGTMLVGGNGRITVVMVEDEKQHSVGHLGRPLILLGLDAKTGAPRFRLPAPEGSTEKSGFTPDGKSFYLVNDNNVVTVYDAATGQKRWSSPKEPDSDRVKHKLFGWLKDPPGMFRFAEDAAFLHDPATGKTLFRVKVPANTFVVPQGYPLEFYDIETNGDPPLTLQILDPHRGTTLGSIAVPTGTTVYSDPAGGFYTLNQFLTAYDAVGKERVKTPAEPPNLHVFADFVTLFSGDRLVALGRQDFARLFAANGSLAAQPGSSASSGILLYQWMERGSRIGQATLLRVTAKPK